MAKLIIPPDVIDGFKEIAKFDEIQINELANYLDKFKVGTKFEELDKFINSKLHVSNSNTLVKTIISLGELLESEDVNYSELAHELRDSIEQSLQEENVSKLDNLEFNLVKIFENSKNLKLTIKAYNLLLENSNVYVDGKIISDIRLIFNDNLTEPNRNGVIIHRLHLTLQNKKDSSEIILTIDNSDLKKLKDVIDRALLKEDIIKEDYENIHFINN